MVDYVINHEKLITAEEFNTNLTSCKLNERDSNNKPSIFKTRKRNSKYEGSAGQLRVLSRIITLVLADVLDQSQVGSMIVALQEVSQIITAPKLTRFEVVITMKDIIESYLDRRVEAIEEFNMPKPRPKHHMISHYPRCYLKYGPLIGMWSLRMESKHTFIKSVIKSSKNFKNVTKTAATRHEMAQICHRYYGLFPTNKYEIPSDAVMLSDYREGVDYPNVADACNKFSSESLLMNKVKVFGTTYSPGKAVVMNKDNFGELSVGLIKIIILSDNKVYFLCKTVKIFQDRHNFYIFKEVISENVWLAQDDLLDYYPLTCYGSASNMRLVLHHFVSER